MTLNITAPVFLVTWSREANHQKHDTYASTLVKGLLKIYVRGCVCGWMEVRKFDEGRAMDGNKSYYLSESGLIYRAVRVLRILLEAQGIYLR